LYHTVFLISPLQHIPVLSTWQPVSQKIINLDSTWYSAEHIPPQCYVEISNVSLMDSYRCTGLKFPVLHHNWFSQLCFHSPCPLTTGLSLHMLKYPEYILDHFQNLINYFLIHTLPAPQIL